MLNNFLKGPFLKSAIPIVFIFAAFFVLMSNSASAANCTQFQASGFFFDNFENAEYINNLLTLHFKLKEPFNDGRLWRSSFSVLSDECIIGTTDSLQKFNVIITPGVKNFSVRFTSPTHYEIWNDEANIRESCADCSGDIPAFPEYYEISFNGAINGWSLGESLLNSSSYRINTTAADPPIKTSTLPTPPNCTPFQASGYFFDNYEHTEYVNGLLTYHFRFKTPYNDGRPWFFQTALHDQSCNMAEFYTVPGNPYLNTQITPYVRYYSVRFSSPTHYDIWNDETNQKEISPYCPSCSVDIPPRLSNGQPYNYISFRGLVDGGASILSSTPFPIQEILPNPSITEPDQFKSDGLEKISEGNITTEDTVMFQAVVNSSINNQVKLQIEVKDFLLPFDGTDILESSLVNSGNAVFVTKSGLVDGQYKWRARAVDENNNKSDWQEFGISGNVDFEVKLVPLYTQGLSKYPSEIETAKWAGETYANSNANCGRYISTCGCAITSSVMIARYHGFTTDVNNKDVNPGNINEWLKSNDGYWPTNDIKWEKVPDYVNKNIFGSPRLRYDGPVAFKDTDTLDSYLKRLTPDPTVLKVMTWSQKKQKYGPHYIVADGKLTDTYTVKDPGFYNTKNLNQAQSSYVYNYNNDFKELRLYTLDDITNPHGVDSISGSLASPAEILITDPQGRKLGKDPVSNTSYNGIPGGSYYLGGIGDPTDESAIPIEESKFFWIPEPLSGNYNIQVIGTGSGEYHLYLDTQDTNGSSTINSFSGATQTGLISDYSLDYSSIPDIPTEVERVVTIPDIIKDVEISYNLGWITKKQIKNLFITELKVIQQLIVQREKQPKYKEKLNKIIVGGLNLFIKEVRLYQKKGIVNGQALEFLINDAKYIINHL